MSWSPADRRISAAVAVAALAATLLTNAAGVARGARREQGDTAAVYLTTPHGQTQLQRQPDLRFGTGGPQRQFVVGVDERSRYQRMLGFGAAFTDSSAWLISRLPATEREQLLKRLFDHGDGIGLSMMRVPIAASDFSVGAAYSYDDMRSGQADPSLAHFSIARDEAYVLPVIRAALALDPRLRLIATPWSPPAWMKTNDSLFGVAAPFGPGTLNPLYYDALARYFVKFLQAYRAAGAPIWALTPQNEPLQPTVDYPGMFLTPAQEAIFVHDHLRPALRAAGFGAVGIYGYDYTWLGAEGYVPALAAGAPGDLAGIAYHCYFGAPEAMSAMHAALPRLDAIEDECSTGISVLSPIQVVIRSAQNWASAVLMWNVALDRSGGPKMGSGCLSCIGVATVDPASGSVAYTGDYYQLGQASKFVQPGARRIAASVTPDLPAHANSPVAGLEATAFDNPDGSVVALVTDSGPALSFTLRRADGKHLDYSLPQQQPPGGTDNSQDAAVVTFVWRPRR